MNPARPAPLLGKLPLLLTLLGVVLAVGQFLHDRGLWTDEAFLALNILDRSIPELMRPLNDDQVAPFLFLVLEKAFSELLPGTDAGFRIVPLLSYLVGSFAFLRITRSVFHDSGARIFAVSLFVFNGNLIYYASEAKQYMGDVAVAMVITLLVLRYISHGRGTHALGAVAVISIWFSSITPIVVVAALASILSSRYRSNTVMGYSLRPFLFWACIWCTNFALYYIVAVHDHPAQDPLRSFWLSAGGLLPNDPFSPTFYTALYGRAYMVFHRLLPFGIIGAYVLVILTALGIFSWLRTGQRALLVLLVMPALLHLSLAILHVYPFDTRLLLYVIPAFALICAEGFRMVHHLLLGVQHPSWKFAPLTLVLFAVAFLHSGYPMDRQEVKLCLDFIEANAGMHDKVFVDPGAGPIFRYYDKQRGYDPVRYVDLERERTDPDRYLRDIGDTHGPFWFLITDLRVVEARSIIAHWDSLGNKRSMEYHVSGAHAYRYSLP